MQDSEKGVVNAALGDHRRGGLGAQPPDTDKLLIYTIIYQYQL